MFRGLFAAMLLSLPTLGLGMCSSRDDAIAAREAALASSTLQVGALNSARSHIRKALAIRDNVGDYWLLSAQIAVAQGDGRAAYDAYRNLIALDRANVDALRALCQLGSQFGEPGDLDRFADQLALLAPDDSLPVTAHGNAALMRGNLPAADKLAEQALASSAVNPEALVLKSRILRAKHDFGASADILKRLPNKSAALYAALADTYRVALDRPGYLQALRDLIAVQPANETTAVTLADLQYQDGARDDARATIAAIIKQRPADQELSNDLLDLWISEGANALTPEQIVADAKGAPLEMRAAYAQYANEMHRPDLALGILPDAPSMRFGIEQLDAQAAYAEALALKGNGVAARRVVDAVLAVDPTHPRGLIAHSRLAWARGDRQAAIYDVRQVAAEDPDNATARILLSRYFDATGETTLSMSALREGLSADPRSTRMTAALAQTLIQRGKPGEAADALRTVVTQAPFNLRAQRLRAQLCPQTGVSSCNAALRLSTAG